MTENRGSLGELSRRNVLLASAATVAMQAIALCRSTSPARADIVTITGHVVEDIDETGLRRAGAPGIPGAMVSNGREVAITDLDGRWQLPITDGDSVFIIKPSHWSLPGKATGVPQFSRLHQPAGSPQNMPRRYSGVAPTGDLPGSIDFVLQRRPEPSRFDVVLVADTQPGNDEELSFVRDAILAPIAGKPAAFAIHHGDVVGDRLDLLERYVRMLETTGLVWHHCPGNHDLNLDCMDPSYALETWKRVFGPPHYAFQYGGATFIILNNVDYFGSGARGAGRPYRGLIGKRQLAFVANVLRNVPKDELVVVSMHIPLTNHEAPGNPADVTTDRQALLAMLSDRPHSVSFSGHSHTTEHHLLGAEHGFTRRQPHHHQVLTAACGSWWSGPRDHRGIPVAISRDGSPKGYHVLSIDSNRYTTRYIAADASGPMQMRVFVARRQATGEAWQVGCQFGCNEVVGTEVYVDVFDGSAMTNVTLSVVGSAHGPISMTRVGSPNPFVAEFFAHHAELCKPWVAASHSSHLWSGPLPRDLSPGVYRLAAHAVDHFGRQHSADLLLEITA
ncbi:MAG: calcineurin-like phosphoesterase C-terminal domain-containing protein [Hyphomicrobiaceae bacterium]